MWSSGKALEYRSLGRMFAFSRSLGRLSTLNICVQTTGWLQLARPMCIKAVYNIIIRMFGQMDDDDSGGVLKYSQKLYKNE